MSLSPGTRLGPYEIISRVGAGGMGEVFRARDTRLDRTVAVKTLPAELAGNAQLRLRLQREAKAISALTHPNICALYDVGEQDGIDFLVMEFLEGESLADRLLRGALPLKDALRYAIELAAALERAHRDGIAHRDLKPGNVMLTRGGAKLADFGLARAPAIETATPFDATQQKPLTAEGAIVGTFQYMAPEQLEGQQVDQRSDLFAFGATLYEMITGVRAFSGKTKTSLIASIVAGSPRPMSELQPVTPPELENLVQRCLEKDPDARWQSAHDVRLELEWIARQLDAPAARAQRRSRVPWTVAAIAVAVAGAASFVAWRATRTAPAPRALHVQIPAPRGHAVVQSEQYLSISPDGRFMTFGTHDDERIWIRSLAGDDARPIEGTAFGNHPFWSPDSRQIGFFADGKLKKVTLDGSPPAVICDAAQGRGGAWNRDGVILFSPRPRDAIYRVPAGGGTPAAVSKLDTSRESTHRWVQFLPDGKHFFYLAAWHETVGAARDTVYLSSLDAPAERTSLLQVRSNVVYAAGHLLFVREGQLVAQSFDVKRLALSGEPFRVGGAPFYHSRYFRGTFAAAEDGALVYTAAAQPDDFRLMWWEAGTEKEALRPKVKLDWFSLSPDERSIAAIVIDPQTDFGDIWLFDLTRGASRRITTTPEVNEYAVMWSRDGKTLLFSRRRGRRSELVAADLASGSERILFFDPRRDAYASDISSDGAWLLMTLWQETGTHPEVNVLPMRGNSPPRPLVPGLPSQFGRFSPDGQWVAYAVNPNERSQLRIARFPDGAHETQLDTEYAWTAQWINAGEVLVTGPSGLRILPLTREGNAWIAGTTRVARPELRNVTLTATNDGKRFLDLVLDPASPSQATTLVTGWASRYGRQ